MFIPFSSMWRAMILANFSLVFFGLLSFFNGIPTFEVYQRNNVLCCKERSPEKKKYSNSKVREKI